MLPKTAITNRSWGRRRLFVVLGLGITLALFVFLMLVPAGVRALPGRYAARLPAFLQELRHRPHPDLLPTPASVATPIYSWPATPTAPRLSGVTFLTGIPTVVADRNESGQAGPGAAQETATADRPTATSAFLAARPTTAPTARPTLIPAPTGTATATAAPTASPTTTPTPTPSLPVSVALPPITHTHQTWNNCGPATVSMALLYFGQTGTQADAARFLKPDPEDKNVSPPEMAAYVRSLGLEALVRVGGSLERLKRLLYAGFPVIVETWFIPEPGDQMGHYRLLTGYDDAAGQFIAQDSYNGPNVRLEYAAFDELWRVFNRVYLIVYAPSQGDQLPAILGDEVADQAMFGRALETARVEAANPGTECVAYEDCADGTAFAWFNVGSNLTHLGRHEEAAAAYDQARLLGLPWRTLWYQFGPYESYHAVSRFDDVITLATVTLNVVDNLEESHYWRGLAYLAQGKTQNARADFQSAITYNPNFEPAKLALESLP